MSKSKLWLRPTGDSISVDTKGDVHFFNCLFNGVTEPPERCGGWDKAEKYEHCALYDTEWDAHPIVSMDITKLICPYDCFEDCNMDQWKDWDGGEYDVVAHALYDYDWDKKTYVRMGDENSEPLLVIHDTII